ncbi:hypothetical protein M8J77_022045 [Diaphorina citri]|nr:hypothetical protein M8J77_022045 [Diaphorina citri]
MSSRQTCRRNDGKSRLDINMRFSSEPKPKLGFADAFLFELGKEKMMMKKKKKEEEEEEEEEEEKKKEEDFNESDILR